VTSTVLILPFRVVQSRPLCLLAIVLLVAGSALADQACDYCGKPIADSYIQYDGRTYHPACYHRNIAPKCGVCGEEILRDGIIFEGTNYHSSCYEDRVALRCSVCGGIIEGEYLLDHWGNKYHKHHDQEIPSCSFCGRLFSDPLAGGGSVLDAAHKICASCAGTAVSDQKVAQTYVDQAVALLTEIGIPIKAKSFKFELTTRDELVQLSGKNVPDQFGLTHYKKTTYWGFLEDKTLMVYVVTGLPRMYFLSTAAHELMHAWLFLNARYDADEGDPQMIEGSCNAAAMLVLNRLNDEMADYVVLQMEADTDPVYGEGFRRARHLVENRGVEYWLEHIRLDPEFPIGY
jgi:hypothetical protein